MRQFRVYIVGNNTPGYLPDSDPSYLPEFDTAKGCLIVDIERYAEAFDIPDDAGVLEAIRIIEGIDHTNSDTTDIAGIVAGHSFWIAEDVIYEDELPEYCDPSDFAEVK